MIQTECGISTLGFGTADVFGHGKTTFQCAVLIARKPNKGIHVAIHAYSFSFSCKVVIFMDRFIEIAERAQGKAAK